jgi:hypothetical protein
MKDKKVFSLTDKMHAKAMNHAHDTFENPQVTFMEEYFWWPTLCLRRWIKNAVLTAWTFFKVAVFTLGLVALYYIWSFHAGYIDLTILSQGDMKLLSGDLLKPAPTAKKK